MVQLFGERRNPEHLPSPINSAHRLSCTQKILPKIGGAGMHQIKGREEKQKIPQTQEL